MNLLVIPCCFPQILNSLPQSKNSIQHKNIRFKSYNNQMQLPFQFQGTTCVHKNVQYPEPHLDPQNDLQHNARMIKTTSVSTTQEF